MSLDTPSEEPHRLLPNSVEALIYGWAWRAFGGAMVFGSVLIWIALANWTASDPSLTHATSGETRNILGPFGAITSDLFLQMFGLAAVAALVGPLVWGVQLVSCERLLSLRWKAFLFVIAVLLLAGGMSAVPTAKAWPLAHGYGGFIGDLVIAVAAGTVALLNSSIASTVGGLVCAAAGGWLLMQSLGVSSDDLKTAWLAETPRAMRDLPKPPPVPKAARMDSWLRHWADQASKSIQRRAERQIAQGQIAEGQIAEGQVAERQVTKGHAAARTAAEAEPPQVASGPEAHAVGPVVSRPHSRRWGHEAELERDAGQDLDLVHYADQADPRDNPQPPPQSRVARSNETSFGSSFATRSGHDVDFDADEETDADADAGDSDLPQFLRDRSAPRKDVSAEPTTKPLPDARSRTSDRAPKSPLGDPLFAEPDQTPIATDRGPPPALARRRKVKPAGYRPPSLSLLERAEVARQTPDTSQTVLRGNAGLLEDVMADFGIKGAVRDVRPGPVITLYEVEIARGVKASRVIGLADDIARSMSAPSARISVIPGRNTLGIELPNLKRTTVRLREILEADTFRATRQTLPLALGKTIDGTPHCADLARMPHVLVAGTTGSGKSVGVNAMILSLLYQYGPADLRMLLIDPKMLELSVYNGIPHLLAPVVTDPHKAVSALNWAISEMEDRYKRMAELGVRNIAVYNARVREADENGETLDERIQIGFDRLTGDPIFETRSLDLTPLPHIVVIVDEFADLMIVAGKEIEAAVQRLAQMARAAGIHLIMATQRPSVDVVTGTIKANFPTRIGFKVASKVDSRTILNEQGAEQLLGQGDMLVSDGSGQLARVHGAFVSDSEVAAVADYLRKQPGPGYVDAVADMDAPEPSSETRSDHRTNRPQAAAGGEDLFDKAVAVVMRDRKASTSYLQRRLQIGYNRAADLIERMERDGVIGPANHAGKREIYGPVDADD
ncbi:MAG: DNA translocase FtsK [Pseudomonadota bacterium]